MDSAHRPQSNMAAVIVVITALYWLAMFAGTHWPVTPRPGEIPTWLDKPQHLVAFGGLAFLLCMTGAAFSIPFARLAAMVLVTIAIYGTFDELTQNFVKHRQASVADWMADMLGAGLGIAAFAVGRQFVGAFRSRAAEAT